MMRLKESPVNPVLYACAQSDGYDNIHAASFLDECFVVAEDEPHSPNAGPAAALCTETLLWGYRLIRERPFYWQDKKKLLRRMMRAANITLFKQHNRAAVAAAAIPGENRCWIARCGPTSVYLFDGKRAARIGMTPGVEHDTVSALGLTRYAEPEPALTCDFIPGHVLLIATPSVAAMATVGTVKGWLENAGSTQDSLRETAQRIIRDTLTRTGRGAAAAILKRATVR